MDYSLIVGINQDKNQLVLGIVGKNAFSKLSSLNFKTTSVHIQLTNGLKVG